MDCRVRIRQEKSSGGCSSYNSCSVSSSVWCFCCCLYRKLPGESILDLQNSVVSPGDLMIGQNQVSNSAGRDLGDLL